MNRGDISSEPTLHAKAQQGFTLLELLVVMTLLSLLMTGLMSAMRTMAQTETKIDQRFARLDQLRTAHAFLSQTLSRQSAALINTPGSTAKPRIAFSAMSDSVTWVGILPARPGIGGRHYFRLTIEEADSGDALALRLAPYDSDLKPPDWSVAERHWLVLGVSKLAVLAQGLPPQGREQLWPMGWQSNWPVMDVLPDQLRLSLQGTTQTELLQWTFALHALSQTDDSISTVSFGGGRR